MTVNDTTTESIDRLKSDIATIRTAFDDRLPFTKADIRFGWIGIFSLGVCILMEVAGFNAGASRWQVAAPLLMFLVAYAVWMMNKSKRKSDTPAKTKMIYRFTAIGGTSLLIGLLLLRKWGDTLGIPQESFATVGACVLGLFLMIASFAPVTSSKLYWKGSLLYGGSAIIALGIIYPMLKPENVITTICGIAILILAPYTLWMGFLLKKETENSPKTTDVQ